MPRLSWPEEPTILRVDNDVCRIWTDSSRRYELREFQTTNGGHILCAYRFEARDIRVNSTEQTDYYRYLIRKTLLRKWRLRSQKPVTATRTFRRAQCVCEKDAQEE